MPIEKFCIACKWRRMVEGTTDYHFCTATAHDVVTGEELQWGTLRS